MRVRKLILASLGALGLALYLWPALVAPVVLWADSEVDLKWARQGIGLWQPLTAEEIRRAGIHPLKPGYLLFLRGASLLRPVVGETRSIVLVQSLILWLAIAVTSAVFARRRGAAAGVALYVVLLLFLPLRNSASAVMSEAVAAALLLPLIAAALFPPRQERRAWIVGLGLAVLFAIRPNVGAVAFLITVLLWLLRKEIRGALRVSMVFVLLVAAGYLALRPLSGGASARGLPDVLIFGGAEYDWVSLEHWPEPSGSSLLSDARIRRAVENWRETLRRPLPDVCRELVWRAFHGLFGGEYYDARWSASYRHLHSWMRVATPFLVLAAIAVLLLSPFTKGGRALGWTALAFLVLLVWHNLLLGSAPRLMIPFLPGVIVLAIESFFSSSRPRWLLAAAAGLFLLLVALVAAARQVTSWDWGLIEASGVRIHQRLPAGALPRDPPATLHLRLATRARSMAQVELRCSGRLIYRSLDDRERHRPVVTVALPDWILDANAKGPIDLELLSVGRYASFSFLIFPVIPPPWGAGARRQGSTLLSPGSDVVSGSLDWWAHSGIP